MSKAERDTVRRWFDGDLVELSDGLRWARPHGTPQIRRMVAGMAARLEEIEDVVAPFANGPSAATDADARRALERVIDALT